MKKDEYMKEIKIGKITCQVEDTGEVNFCIPNELLEIKDERIGGILEVRKDIFGIILGELVKEIDYLRERVHVYLKEKYGEIRGEINEIT